MPSGPRGRITLGILAPLGFQLRTMAIKYSLVTAPHPRVSPGHLHWQLPNTYIVYNCRPKAAAQTYCLYAHVWLDLERLHADSPVLPHSASGRFHSC